MDIRLCKVDYSNYEEEIMCKFCESQYRIIYKEDTVSNKLLFCAFCGEELDDDYIEEDSESDEQ